MTARSQIYRKDQQCPRCDSNWLPRYVRPRGKQANWNERLHSVLRDNLNRLHSRIRGYRKSVTLLRDSIA